MAFSILTYSSYSILCNCIGLQYLFHS